MKRRRFAAAAAPLLCLALAGTGLPVLARSVARPDVPGRIGRLLQLSVIDRASGRELPVYFHAGDYWVAGVQGARYALRVHNRQPGRLLAVMSVDGVNVVTGERAGVDQNGYVLDGGERADIAGWRKSDQQVAAFEFTVPDAAYASRTGRPEHLGVIGVALFHERVRPAPRPAPPLLREESAKSAEAAAAESEAVPAGRSALADRMRAPVAPAPQLGTGHGERENAPVSHTQFTRARSTPDEVIRLRYDSRANLVARGVIPAPLPRPRPNEPQPFPASPSETGYVPDPPPRR